MKHIPKFLVGQTVASVPYGHVVEAGHSMHQQQAAENGGGQDRMEANSNGLVAAEKQENIGDGHDDLRSPSPLAPTAYFEKRRRSNDSSFDEIPDFSDDDASEVMSDDEDFGSTSINHASSELIEHDILVAHLQLADPQRLTQTSQGVSLVCNVTTMHDATRRICMLPEQGQICAKIDLSRGYTRSSPMPKVKFSVVSVNGSQELPKIISIYLERSIQKLLDANFKSRDENFLYDLFCHFEDRLHNCGNTCVLCDEKLTFPGLKPTICDSALCSYQFEELNIVNDLSIIIADPNAADFLCKATLAAAQSWSQDSPYMLPQRPFVTLSAKRPMTGDEIAGVLKVLPNLASLPVDNKERTAALEAVHPATARILSWIFATNSADLVSVEASQQFAIMKTSHQLKINTATRKHADAFEKLKAKHGSFLAFHGSPMKNWHNILRKNIINASQTGMMANGAAYGNGIYLAANSGASAGYCSGPDLRCIALCEVVNAPSVHRHAHDSIIVASDAQCVCLRYLFVYDSTTYIPFVDAQSLSTKRYKNQTTIIWQNNIEDIPKERELVTADDYMWDMEELVKVIQGNHGIFRNEYTKQGFIPSDVAAILHHRSGLGKVLLHDEKCNIALRAQISPRTYAMLHAVGRVCKDDNTMDFMPSQSKIAELQRYIESLSQNEKAALQSAPFEATDSHTLQVFRNTVHDELKNVSSLGQCVHRFGDFLMQTRA